MPMPSDEAAPPAALPDDVLDRVFRAARTANTYTDRPVGEDTLRALYELMKWGPTSTNQAPLRIVWCVSDASKARLASFCAGGNVEKVRRAPVTAILGMDLEFYELLPRLFVHAPDARSWYAGNPALIERSALQNSSLQAAYLIVAARLLGLGAGPMAGFDADGINAAFFAGTAVRVNMITTLGYTDPATVYPRGPRLSFDEVSRTC